MELENRLEYFLALGTWRVRIGTVFSQKDDNNEPEDETDINTLQSAFLVGLSYTPSANNFLWSNLSYTKFEYNSPNFVSESNTRVFTPLDRDEIRFVFDGGFRHRFSPYFSAVIKANVYLNHQIFIRAKRSSNNNWNRVFQLSAAFDHRVNNRIRHWSQLKILSNFTVFDFEELFPEVRSFVFRRLTYNDTLSIQLTKNLALKNFYRLELDDNGTFFQDDFSQLTTTEKVAHFINLYFEHSDVWGLKVAPGISFLYRDEWSINPRRELVKVRKFRGFTPRLTISYPASKRLILFITYASDRTNDSKRSTSEINFRDDIRYRTTGQVKMIYNF